jgi:hypothetical protein
VPHDASKVCAGAATTLAVVSGLSAATSAILASHAAEKCKPGGAKTGGAKTGGAKTGGAKTGGAKTGGAKAGGQTEWLPISLLQISSSSAERRLAEAIARPLLSFAAGGGLKHLGEWRGLTTGKTEPAWGKCPLSVPPRPTERWEVMEGTDGSQATDHVRRYVEAAVHLWSRRGGHRLSARWA